MSSKSGIESGGRVLLVALGLCAVLGGCSDIYYDRRDTVALGADDHIASNMVAQMADPWPRYVGNPRIRANGERMVGAVQRYQRPQAARSPGQGQGPGGQVTNPTDGSSATPPGAPSGAAVPASTLPF